MPDVIQEFSLPGDLRDVREREDQLLLAGSHVDMEHAGPRRRKLVAMFVGESGIAVPGAHDVQSGKVGNKCETAIRAEGIDRRGKRPELLGLDVQQPADEFVPFPVVPGDFGLRPGPPLEHAALLPAPGVGLSELDPLVCVGEVHHADIDDVPRLRGAMFEVDFIREHVAIRRIELEFVVVAEPVIFRPAGDGPDRGKLVCRGAAGEAGQGGGGEAGGQEITAAERHGGSFVASCQSSVISDRVILHGCP